MERRIYLRHIGKWNIRWEQARKINLNPKTPTTTTEELKQPPDNFMEDISNLGIPEFEGYSPNEMQYILYTPFSEKNPVKLQQLNDEGYDEMPLFRQIMYVANMIAEKGQIKLTAKGFLPTKIVAEMYHHGNPKEKFIEMGLYKLYKERDSITVNLTRILLEISGIAKKRKGILSLTKKGEKLLSDKPEFFKQIFTTFCTKFHWAYYDGYETSLIGQFGFAFSLILVNKYGAKKRSVKFYAEKYFDAFPKLLEGLNEREYTPIDRLATGCYSLRTFNRFLYFFGLVRIDEAKSWEDYNEVQKTELFDRLIHCNLKTDFSNN
ncbi:MAG TPA: hypothetical protein ENN08_07655 [Bacteroidales bacterium]|nr:hypothetical protein [Bacteroidales bacterium]